MHLTDSLTDLAAGQWEPCAHHEGEPGGVCAACGWLDHEHPRNADIVTLTPPRRTQPAARRLAS